MSYLFSNMFIFVLFVTCQPFIFYLHNKAQFIIFFSFLQVVYVVSIDLDDWSLDHNFLPCIS